MRQRQYNSFLARYQTELLLIDILAVLFPFFENTSPVLFQLETLMRLLKQVSVYGIIVIGVVFVITSSGIDISVGSVVRLSDVIVAMAMVSGVPIPIAILLTITSSALVGLFNGILMYDANVPPFTATLGSLTVVRNFILLIIGAKTISDLPKMLTNFAADSLLGIPYLFLSQAVFVRVDLSIAKKITLGRNIYAYGSNREAARLSGIRMRSVVYGVYIFCSSVCGVAGILFALRLGDGVPNAGTGYELDAIAATVVDEVSLDGDEGSVIGAVLSTMIITTLRQGETPLGINSFIMGIIIGSLIVIAVVLGEVQKKRNWTTQL